jgi:hypothetical protein
MLNRFKKKKPEVTLHWHPNFRIVATLPDIKTVRTGFIVNGIAAVLFVISLWWMLQTEIDMHHLNKESADYQAGIDDKTKDNTTYLALDGKFVADSKKLQFLAKFYDDKISEVNLINALVKNRPDNLLFETISVLPLRVELTKNNPQIAQEITVTGTIAADEPKEPLNDFLHNVLATPMFKDRVLSNKPTFNHEPTSGISRFTIVIDLKP